MPRRNLVWIVGILLITAFSWAVVQGGLTPPHGPLQFVKGFPGQGKDYDNLALFIDVMQHVDMNYVRQLSDQERRKFIETAIQAGLASLDPHSSFINPKEAIAFKKQIEGKFGGIGVQGVVNRITKCFDITSPIVGTPAFKAGIKPGDSIEKVNGESLAGLINGNVLVSNDNIVDKISGPPGTHVTITLRRRGSGRRMEITLERAEIQQEAVLGDSRREDHRWDFMTDKKNRIGFIRLGSYSPIALQELKDAIAALERESAQAIVLDLRNNPGGSLEGAVEVCNLFLEEGEIVRVEGRSGESRSYAAQKNGALFSQAASLPMAVLINESSASASEIVSAALQDHRRAVILGERSFGKGSVQRIYPMEAGASRLRLTTAKYIRPNGKNIHRFVYSKDQDDWGVRPDIEVKLTPQEELDWLRGRRDRDVVRDPESDRLDHVERIATVLGPLSILPNIGGPMAVVPGLLETSYQVANLPRPAENFSDKVLDKALDYLRQKITLQQQASQIR